MARFERRIRAEKIVDPQDPGQGCPQLVAHVGDEIRLDPRGVLRDRPGPLEITGRALTFGDVAQRTDQELRGARVGVADEVDRGFEPDPVPELVAHPIGRGGPVTGDRSGRETQHDLLDGSRVVRMDGGRRDQPDHLLGFVAQHGPASRRGILPDEVEVELGDDIARRVGEHAVPRFAFPDRSFGAPPGRDVRVGRDHGPVDELRGDDFQDLAVGPHALVRSGHERLPPIASTA